MAAEQHDDTLRSEERRASILSRRLDRARDRIDLGREQHSELERSVNLFDAAVDSGAERERELLDETESLRLSPRAQADGGTNASEGVHENGSGGLVEIQAVQRELQTASEELRGLTKNLRVGQQRVLESRAAAKAAMDLQLVSNKALSEAVAGRDAQCARLGVTSEDLDGMAKADPAMVTKLRAEIESADREFASAEALLVARRADGIAHDATNRPIFSPLETASVAPKVEAIAETLANLQRTLLDERAKDDAAREHAASATVELEERRERLRPWIELGHRMGDGQGQRFEQFAQSLTMHALLVGANRHLDDLAPRYELAAVPGVESLELQVVDRELGDSVRSVRSLSGGETFLVSLALALGLTTLSAGRTRIESLFLDEGFGSLDPKTVDTALEALDALQATGCQVCVISHVEGMAERVGCSVEVRPVGGGASELAIGGSIADARL